MSVLTPEKVVVRTPPRGRRRRPGAGLLGAVVLALAGIAALPWEWSFIDDTALLGHLHRNQAAHGSLVGVLTTIRGAAAWDVTDWGLFRPAYWVYQGVFYLLPVGPAHAARVGMLGLAVAGPVVALLRQVRAAPGTRVAVAAWASIALLANGPLWTGLWYPSLQELSGAACVGLGLLAGVRRPWWLVTCWALAAWFKAPLAWLLVAFGVSVLLRTTFGRATPSAASSADGPSGGSSADGPSGGEPSGRRITAAAAAAGLLGLGTLAAAAVLAGQGSYASGYLDDAGPYRLAANVSVLAGAAGAPALVLLAGFVLLGVAARAPGVADPVPLVLLAGGAGYAATLLPWGVGGYYAGPPVYLVTAGVLLLVTPGGAVPVRRLVGGVVVAGLLAGVLVASPVSDGVRSVVNTVQLRDCVARLPVTASVGFDAAEGAIRLEQIVRERRPGWRGTIARVAPGQPRGWRQGRVITHFDYYIQTGRRRVAAPLDGPVVCRAALAVVRRVP